MRKCEPDTLMSERSWVVMTWHASDHVTGNPVLLIGPPGCEWERSHRALSILATRLASQGTSVLHLDVSGSGDSAGEMGDFVPEDWEADAMHGLNEVLRRSQSTQAVVCGFRLGCRIVMPLAHNPSVSALVLWEPVLIGAHQLSEWMDAERRILSAMGEVQQVSARGFPTSCLGQVIPDSLAVAMSTWVEPTSAIQCPVCWLSAGRAAPQWATRTDCPGPRFWESDPTDCSTPHAMIGQVARTMHDKMSYR